MPSLGTWPRPCGAVSVALLMLAAVSGSADARGRALLIAPRIFLPVRASQLPDPLPSSAALRTRTVHFSDLPVSRDYFGWLTAHTQVRYGRGIDDFYPVKGSGFRLSGGTRFYMAYWASDTSPDARSAMQYDPRGTLAMPTLRDGYSGAPVALVGYGRRIGERWSVGVDAGAMLGQAMTVFPYDDRPDGKPDDRPRPSQRINPLLDVTVALGF